VLNPVNVQPGDRVRVTGRIGVFRGVRQIGRDERAGGPTAAGPEVTIEVLGAAPVPVRPVTLAQLLAAAEAHESQLVELARVSLVANPTTGAAPPATFAANSSLFVSDGAATITLRIAGGTDLVGRPTPAGPFLLRGIWTQFTTTGRGSYQLQPRGAADLVASGVPPQDAGVLDAGSVDAGARVDAGAMDAGAPSPDAADEPDAGDAPLADASAAPDAAPSPDAADPAPLDAGAPPAPDAGPRLDSGLFGGEEPEGEGCGCAATPARDRAAPSALALLGFALLARRRRRR
jgi:MYXO-CTERM domain-containing protein